MFLKTIIFLKKRQWGLFFSLEIPVQSSLAVPSSTTFLPSSHFSSSLGLTTTAKTTQRTFPSVTLPFFNPVAETVWRKTQKTSFLTTLPKRKSIKISSPRTTTTTPYVPVETSSAFRVLFERKYTDVPLGKSSYSIFIPSPTPSIPIWTKRTFFAKFPLPYVPVSTTTSPPLSTQLWTKSMNIFVRKIICKKTTKR